MQACRVTLDVTGLGGHPGEWIWIWGHWVSLLGFGTWDVGTSQSLNPSVPNMVFFSCCPDSVGIFELCYFRYFFIFLNILWPPKNRTASLTNSASASPFSTE